MKLFFSKRGNFQELVLGPLFPLIIVIAVFIIMLSYISVVSQSSYFEREFLTKDIGLLVEALQASPHNAQVNYPDDNGKKAKDLKITINKNLVKAHPYNIDPKIAPSKSSAFSLFPSNMTVIELVASPRLEKNTKGENTTFSYRLYFLKDSKGITPSLNQINIPSEKDESYFKSLIYTTIENWYSTPRLYIDTIYTSGITTPSGGISGQGLLDNICSRIDRNDGIYPSGSCSFSKSTLDERKANAQKADFIVVLYVNEKKQSPEIIDIYYIETSDDARLKSIKLAGISQYNLKVYYGDTTRKRLEDPLKSQILPIVSNKPTIVVEIGNIEKLNREDIAKIGDSLYRSIETYYTT